MSETLIRFWSKVEKTDGCWEWRAGKDGDGYGRFKVLGKTWGAHRFSYVTEIGSIPDGLEIDHLCRNRSCVRPDHLEPVTRRENVIRGEGITGREARATHCIHGHEFTEENTYRNGGRRRECRLCRRLRDDKRRPLRREYQREVSRRYMQRVRNRAWLGKELMFP